MDHLTIDDLAAFLERRLDDASRARVEAHLADCDECRRELVDAQAMLRSAPRPRAASSRRPLAVLAMLAAAAVVVVLLPRRAADDGPAVERTAPGSAPAAVPAIAIVSPAPEARVERGPVPFVWRARADASLYKVTLTDEQGRIVWSTSTRDTLATTPASTLGAAAGRHYWYVDALSADGRAVSSGVHAFSVR